MGSASAVSGSRGATRLATRESWILGIPRGSASNSGSVTVGSMWREGVRAPRRPRVMQGGGMLWRETGAVIGTPLDLDSAAAATVGVWKTRLVAHMTGPHDDGACT